MKVRRILYPLAIIYDAITTLRNLLYSKGVFKTVSFNLPLIAFGNLSTGGTGKTPHTAYVAGLLSDSHHTAILSRGYGRKSSGFRIVHQNSQATEAGDEPLMLKRKLSHVTVAVCESRVEGVRHLLEDERPPEVILLDDALQHRELEPSFRVLLTPYDDLYVDDLILPAGNLRESTRNASRADLIIVTRCPEKLGEDKKALVKRKLSPMPHQHIFFSHLQYGHPEGVNMLAQKTAFDFADHQLMLLTGIANPQPLIRYLNKTGKVVKHFRYADHHLYNADDMVSIAFEIKRYTSPVLVTTEKDVARLDSKLISLLPENLPVYFIPVEVSFGDEKIHFEQAITAHIRNFFAGRA